MNSKPELSHDIQTLAESVKGFMPEKEGKTLHRYARDASELEKPLLEIGTYCGKSAIYLGSAVKNQETVLYTIDHHRGSIEQQPGWEYHDPEVVDEDVGKIDTLPFFRRNIHRADLEETVIAIVGESTAVAANWDTKISLLFIDGGHDRESAFNDYHYWTPFIIDGGYLLIHDVFPDPSDGGRPPYEIFQKATKSGEFSHIDSTGSLRVLRKNTQDE